MTNPGVTGQLSGGEINLILASRDLPIGVPERHSVRLGPASFACGFRYATRADAERYAAANRDNHGHQVIGPWLDRDGWAAVLVVTAAQPARPGT